MNDKKKKVINCFIALIIFICIIFFLFIVPYGTAYGIINGKLDIETLEPIYTQE